MVAQALGGAVTVARRMIRRRARWRVPGVWTRSPATFVLIDLDSGALWRLGVDGDWQPQHPLTLTAWQRTRVAGVLGRLLPDDD